MFATINFPWLIPDSLIRFRLDSLQGSVATYARLKGRYDDDWIDRLNHLYTTMNFLLIPDSLVRFRLDSLLGSFATYARLKGRYDDDWIDRLNHLYTTIIFIIFTIIVSTKQYVGEPIHCWCPAEFKVTGPQIRYLGNQYASCAAIFCSVLYWNSLLHRSTSFRIKTQCPLPQHKVINQTGFKITHIKKGRGLLGQGQDALNFLCDDVHVVTVWSQPERLNYLDG